VRRENKGQKYAIEHLYPTGSVNDIEDSASSLLFDKAVPVSLNRLPAITLNEK
jgi:hypothetical protein